MALPATSGLLRRRLLTLCLLPVLGGFASNSFAAGNLASNANAWQWVWQQLARYGYVHVVYGTYMGRYGALRTVAAWDVSVPQKLQDLSNRWGYSALNPEFRSGVIQFERVSKILPTNGISRGRANATLIARLKAGHIPYNPYPFQWVEVRKDHHPEQLRIWQVPPSSATDLHWRVTGDIIPWSTPACYSLRQMGLGQSISALPTRRCTALFPSASRRQNISAYRQINADIITVIWSTGRNMSLPTSDLSITFTMAERSTSTRARVMAGHKAPDA
nr:hypothetical protein [Acidithiobacillus sp. AMEEHan]